MPRFGSVTGVCLFVGMAFLLAALSSPGFIWGSEAGVASSGENLTPQNDRVAVFGSSFVTDYYCGFLEIILGLEVSCMRCSIPGTAEDAVMLANQFSEPGNEYGIVITDFGSKDFVQGAPSDQIEANVTEMFRRLKASGAIVVYNQFIPESEYPFGRICEEEGVIVVPGDYLFSDLSPFQGEDRFSMPWGKTHPGPYGSAVMAERTARVMLDAGIVEWAEPCDLESFDFAGLYSTASQLIDEVEELNSTSESVDVDIEGMLGVDVMLGYLDLAEPMHEVGACFTTRWLLRDWIIEPLNITVERWDDILNLSSLWERDFNHTTIDWQLRAWDPDPSPKEGRPIWLPENLSRESMPYRLDSILDKWNEVKGMFDEAEECIETLKEQGDTRNEKICSATYSRAEQKWVEYDYDGTCSALNSIIAKCPEPSIAIILGLILLPFLHARRR